MTNEEAIKNIQDFTGWFKKDKPIYEALEMAIKALEKEPIDDKCHYCEHNFTPYQGNTGEFTEQEPTSVKHDTFPVKLRINKMSKHISNIDLEEFEQEPIDKSNLEKICEELAAENDDLRNQLAMKDRFKQEPCDDNRLYIKVYADLEPQEKAEKLYQICEKEELLEVYKELGEYCEIEPCNDAVSRQAVLDCATLITLIPTEDWDIGDWVCLFRDRVSQLPPVRPQESKWIPVSERLPEDGTYLVTLEKIVGEPRIYIRSFAQDLNKVDEFDFPKQKWGWYDYDSEYGYWEDTGVIAWMPLPTPYNKPQEKDICEKCLYAEEINGSHCYECIKGESKFEPTCDTCEYNTAAFMPCNACDNKSLFEPQKSEVRNERMDKV